MHFLSAGPAFIDTETALRAEFRNDTSNSVCVLGGWLLSQSVNIPMLHKQYDRVIVFNQEQIANRTRQFMSLDYYAMLKMADEVWDYDEYNVRILSTIRNDIQLHLLQPCSELNAGTAQKKYDVLFYGELNQHRQTILTQLLHSGINVQILYNVWGDRLNKFIAESKICLNLHFYHDTALQEQARMIRWVSSNATIISEPSRTNYMNVEEIPYDQITKEIICRIK